MPGTLGVIDVDTHVSEPMDLWTSRLPAKWHDDAPHGEWDNRTDQYRWRIGKHLLFGISSQNHAGWREFYPSVPKSMEESDPGSYDPKARLEWMDAHGVNVQVIYPNVLGFWGFAFLDMDPKLRLACVQAFNDYQVEFCSADPDRLIPLSFIPWWDVEESVTEMTRCVEMGHRGLNFGSDFEKLGFPGLRDKHWDPILSAAQEMQLPVSFHIGFGSHTAETIETWISHMNQDDDIRVAESAVLFFLGNAKCITELVLGGVCERFPRLDFLSIESGFGYWPFLMESMDWQYRNNSASLRNVLSMLPSEYMRRQIYGTFWFERELYRFIDLFPDNLLFESDFPHPTGLSPGPGSVALDPRDTIEANLQQIPADIRQKILHDNAARLYKLA
jgi:uncharacterized protein